MTDALAHRGPDDSGYWYDGAVGMGFRRLAIIDTSPGGHQPMVSPDGEHVLVFNGEIYNYVELREELRSLGHRFRSTSDTEVLLAAWRQWGERAVERFLGMFAFAIWDRKRGEVFGARDRLGVKPLFVHQGKDAVIMASEIKAIQASGGDTHRENWTAVAQYLVSGQLHDGPSTCFEGIEQIAPAHTFRISADGQVHQRRYFDWPSELLERADDAPQVVADMLEDSVRLRRRSDVPVGVCLSGGLDSTAIICAIARLRRASGDNSPLLAFSYNAPEYDESRFVAATIRETGATLVSLQTDVRDMWATMPRVLHYHDEPLHAINALVGFQLMALARQHGALVVLNGQGADEALAGYSSYYLSHWVSLVLDGRMRQAMVEIDAYARAFGASSPRLAAQVLRTLVFRTLQGMPGYARAARAARDAKLRESAWFTPEVTGRVPDRGVASSLRLDAVQRHSVTTAPLPLYLRIEDRNSMAHGVEVRVPFLDHRLVSYALSLPNESRMRGALNKYSLREAMRGRIPEVVRGRVEKMGFPMPTDRWFGNELYEPLRDLIDSSAARSRGLYQTDNLLRELDQGRNGHVRNHQLLFRIANVETWLAVISERRAAASAAGSPIITSTGGDEYEGPRAGRMQDSERPIALSTEPPGSSLAGCGPRLDLGNSPFIDETDPIPDQRRPPLTPPG